MSNPGPVIDTDQTPRPLIETDDKLITAQSHMVGEKRKRGRPKGTTGAGRPPGSKNKLSLLKEAIAQDFVNLAKRESKAVFKVLAQKAKEGDPAMIKLFLDKVLPNAQTETQAVRGDFGINIVINDMRTEEKVIEDAVWEEKEEQT